MNLVIINPIPTSKIFGKKVDAWWYQNNGFDVEFWDISPIFWSQEKLKGYYGGADDYRYIGPNHQIFSSKGDVLNAMNGLSTNVVIWHLGWNISGVRHNERWLLDTIVEAGISFFVKQFEPDLVLGVLPRIKQWLRLRMARSDFYRRQPAGFVGCGSVSRAAVKQIIPDTAFISVPTPNILWEESVEQIDSPYIVFVDESLEYSPDAKMLGLSLLDDPESYYRRMNELFSEVEDILGCSVIIAASGKYHYTEDRFNGRELIYGQTLSLIQHASLVIGHYSAALNQAVVNRKMILRLSDSSFQKYQRYIIQIGVHYIGSPPFLSDDLESIRKYVMQHVVDDSKAIEIESMYFREPDVQGDYREIIKQAFLSL